MIQYTKALDLIRKGNKLIDVTIDLIKSAKEDLDSVRTIQLTIQHENLCREIDIGAGNFTPQDIIGG